MAARRRKRPDVPFYQPQEASAIQERVLDVARRCATTVGGASSKSSYDEWVIGLWGLFPCFCQHPEDLQQHLEKLIPTLIKAMEDARYPQLLVRATCLRLVPLFCALIDFLHTRLRFAGHCLFWA